jgi:CRISPR/Cas system-associated endoribonuclease Cas2
MPPCSVLISRLQPKDWRDDTPSYLIVYDIRELDGRMRQRVSRRLRKIKALRLQQSVWESGMLGELMDLADSIGMAGGKALVLEKQIVHLSHL